MSAVYSVPTPKIIYSLWLQGRDQVPPVARLCFERWKALNPGYRLEVLDRHDADVLLRGSALAVACLTPQALSDVVRARILAENGGVWVDAAVFPVRALDDWLPDLTTATGFFAFERPTPDRLISSWFLAATPQHPILGEWWKETRRYWAKPRQPAPGEPADPVAWISPDGAAATNQFPYFWFHYLFQYLVEARPDVAALWNRCTKLPAVSAHRLQYLFVNVKNPTEAAIRQAVYAAPVQKLNWRGSYPLDFLAALPPHGDASSPAHAHFVLDVLSTAAR